jgi:hypothetical protein
LPVYLIGVIGSGVYAEPRHGLGEQIGDAGMHSFAADLAGVYDVARLHGIGLELISRRTP